MTEIRIVIQLSFFSTIIQLSTYLPNLTNIKSTQMIWTKQFSNYSHEVDIFLLLRKSILKLAQRYYVNCSTVIWMTKICFTPLLVCPKGWQRWQNIRTTKLKSTPLSWSATIQPKLKGGRRWHKPEIVKIPAGSYLTSYIAQAHTAFLFK